MKRRTGILLGILAASAATSFASGSWSTVRKLLEKPPPPFEQLTHIDDAGGALDAAKIALPMEMSGLATQVGVVVGVVVAPEPGDLREAAAARLAKLVPDGWNETGSLLVQIDSSRRAVAVARSASLDAVLPDPVLNELLVDRIRPFVGQPLLGAALVSGLHRVRDHLLERAVENALALDSSVAERSVATRIRAAMPPIETRCRAGGGGGGAVEARVEQLVCALARGVEPGDGELFTTASRVHLARRPLDRFEGRVRAALLDEGRPWKVSVAGDRAAVLRSGRMAASWLPVLLVREGDTWRVDLVEMEKAYDGDGLGSWRNRNALSPYWLALGVDPNSAKYRSKNLAPVELWGESLEDAIARLERTETPEARRRLAEILLRNVWLPGEALVRWDEALALDPDGAFAARTFANRAEYVGYPLLGAIALAPLGAPEMQRIGELLVESGNVDSGIQLVQKSLQWRAARKAARAAAPPPNGDKAI